MSDDFITKLSDDLESLQAEVENLRNRIAGCEPSRDFQNYVTGRFSELLAQFYDYSKQIDSRFKATVKLIDNVEVTTRELQERISKLEARNAGEPAQDPEEQFLNAILLINS